MQRESRLWREYISTLSQEKALQGEIQELLDSQAAALARTKAGWGNNGEGSSASSSLSGREGRPMTLRKSRIGLLKALNDCSALVAQRTELLSSGCALLREEFRKLDGWQRKVVDIEGQAKREEIAIGNSLHGDRGDDDQKIRQFEDEIKTHEREIANLKIKVAEKRSQLRELRLKDEEKRSQMEAELARFKHARRDIELEAQRWLAHPPDDIFIPSEILESEVEPVIARIINPHPSPRSLEDTHYNLSAVLPLIEHKVEEAEVELEACEAGNDLWEEALEAILTFEGEMARWIKRRGNGVPKSELLKRMEAVGDHLQEALRLAESEGWPLLICILAAEVESWMEGEVVLQEMLGVKGLMRADRKGKGTGKNRDAVMSSMDDDEPTKEPMRPDDFLKEPLQPSGRGRGHSTASTATSEGIWGHNYEPPGLQTRTSSHALDLAEVGYDRPESNSATNLTNASPSCKPGSAVISSDDNSRSQDLKTTTRTSRPEPSFRTALEYSRSHSRPHSRSSIRSQHSDASHHSIEMEGLKISDEASSTPRKAASRFSSPRLGSPMVGVGSGEFGGRTGLGRTERRRTDGAGDGNAGESDGGEPPADLLG